jgi:hypothetical protein
MFGAMGCFARDGMLGVRRDIAHAIECTPHGRETGFLARDGMLGTGPGRECEDARCKPQRTLAT